MSKVGKHHDHENQESPPAPPPLPAYGTFQGVANYPNQPVMGFPQPVPPPGASGSSQYYSHAYQSVPGYAVAEGRPVRERPLCCCGLGMGWLLFIIGFVLLAIPWYVATFIILCARIDHREKPGYVACVIAAIISVIAVVFGVTKNEWD